jgi:hypothetical protein
MAVVLSAKILAPHRYLIMPVLAECLCALQIYERTAASAQTGNLIEGRRIDKLAGAGVAGSCGHISVNQREI